MSSRFVPATKLRGSIPLIPTSANTSRCSPGKQGRPSVQKGLVEPSVNLSLIDMLYAFMFLADTLSSRSLTNCLVEPWYQLILIPGSCGSSLWLVGIKGTFPSAWVRYVRCSCFCGHAVVAKSSNAIATSPRRIVLSHFSGQTDSGILIHFTRLCPHALPDRADTKARDGPRMCFDQNERASFHCEAFLEQFL